MTNVDESTSRGVDWEDFIQGFLYWVETGGMPPLIEKTAPPLTNQLPHTILLPKFWFCNFQVVFGHFNQNVTPPVDVSWKTLLFIIDEIASKPVQKEEEGDQ